MNNSNLDSTVNSTINSTLETTGVDANSTKFDASVADDDNNGAADAIESDTKDEIIENVQGDETMPEPVEVSFS